jgi:sec-independent protein translocase protein TatA
MGPIGIPELIIILIIVLLLFGAKKIPELARSLGTGIAEFKRGFASKESPKTESEEKEKISGDS